jgi:predicted nucleic acid-binding protein
VNVLIDTSVWSLAFRRKVEDLSANERLLVTELTELITEGRTRFIGPIRQELLSGIKTPLQYEKLRVKLAAFPDESIGTSDYESAAKASNDCRVRGISMGGVDALICAVSMAREFAIFSTDPDFQSFTKVLPIRLHSARKRV